MSETLSENHSIKTLKDLIKAETLRAIKKQLPKSEPLQPINDQIYKEAFAGFEREILPPDLLYKALYYLARNWRAVQARYLPGDRCCLTAIPVTDMGVDLTEQEIMNHQYLRLIAKSARDGLTHNFSMYPARYFDLMPELIQKDVQEGGCSFVVEEDDPNQFGKAQSAFIRDYKLAFNNLRKFFGLPTIEEILH
jgi:hypothetical protein